MANGFTPKYMPSHSASHSDPGCLPLQLCTRSGSVQLMLKHCSRRSYSSHATACRGTKSQELSKVSYVCQTIRNAARAVEISQGENLDMRILLAITISK